MSTIRHRSHVPTTHEDDSPPPSTTAQIIRRVRVLDVVYPKAEEEALTRTSSGGSLTMITLTLSLLLFLSEFYSFISSTYTHSITVDTRAAQRVPIIFNISFPHLQCSLTSIDVMDVSGEVQVDASRNIYRTRLSSSGQKIGAPFEDLHMEGGEHRIDRKGEGCLISATLWVQKVAGNVHIALGASHGHEGGGGGSKHMHQFLMPEMLSFDASHRIISFSFGPSIPTAVNPLDGVEGSIPEGSGATAAHFSYFVKIVPTLYTSASNITVHTHQYSVTSQTHLISPFERSDGRRIPGVFFVYDLSPFMVHVKEKRVGFGSFLVSLCAIVGGVVTVAGIIASCIHWAGKITPVLQ